MCFIKRLLCFLFFFFKQKTAYEMCGRDWSSDVCSSDLIIAEVYHDLMLLLERGFKIREYTQVYEELLYRVPIQFVGKDFYKYFPFSRSNENK